VWERQGDLKFVSSCFLSLLLLSGVGSGVRMPAIRNVVDGTRDQMGGIGDQMDGSREQMGWIGDQLMDGIGIRDIGSEITNHEMEVRSFLSEQGTKCLSLLGSETRIYCW